MMANRFIQRIFLIALLLSIQSCIRINHHLGCYGFSSSSSAKKITTKQHANKPPAGTGFGVNPQKPEQKQYISILDKDDPKNELSKIHKQLIETLQSHNAVLDGTEIGIHPNTGQRGLYATKPCSKGKIICKIPSDLALALGDPALQRADAPTVAHAAANFCKFYVQDPRAAVSWKFYLDCLFPPSSSQYNQDDDNKSHKNTFLPTTPDFYTDEEIDLLEFPRIVQAAKQRKRDIQQAAAETGIPFDELQRATAIVSSRSIPLAISELENNKQLTTDDQGQILSKAGERVYIRLLAPYIDMANHRSKEFNAAITILDPEKDEAWFALKATRNIPIGKEITVAYGSGADTSIELLLNYGFVEPGNPMDAYFLKKEQNQKTADDCFSTVSEWSTTLQEDKAMLAAMIENDDDANHLHNILRFRIQMKKSYSQ
jgi:hypothetical protein